MPSDRNAPYSECSCLALRQAARTSPSFYDQRWTPAGYGRPSSHLAKLKRLGPLTINAARPRVVMI